MEHQITKTNDQVTVTTFAVETYAVSYSSNGLDTVIEELTCLLFNNLEDALKDYDGLYLPHIYAKNEFGEIVENEEVKNLLKYSYTVNADEFDEVGIDEQELFGNPSSI